MATNIVGKPTNFPVGNMGGPTMDMFNKRQEIDFMTILQRNVEFNRENNISRPSTAEEKLMKKLLLEHYIRQAEAARRMQMQSMYQASQPEEQETQAMERGLETISY